MTVWHVAAFCAGLLLGPVAVVALLAWALSVALLFVWEEYLR